MDKFYKTGLVIGRFNPIRNGHVYLINEAIKRCQRTLVLVGSAQEEKTLRNPFSAKDRINLIEMCYSYSVLKGELVVKGINDLKNELNNDFSWGEYVISEVRKHLNGDFADLIIYGNDPVKRTWFNPEEIPETYELFVPRAEQAISATYARGLLAIGDKAEWKKVTPEAIHQSFDYLRCKLLGVKEYSEILTEIDDFTIEDFIEVYKRLEELDREAKISKLNADK